MYVFSLIKTNPAKSFEVVSPPDKTVTALEFSPTSPEKPKVFLIAGSSDRTVRCWEVHETDRQTVPMAMKVLSGPVMDVAWTSDANQVFISSSDNMAHLWDLGSDQMIQVAAHDGPVRTCHVINAANYKCLMTGSFDRTVKFWDTRTAVPMAVINLPERCCCAAVDYPMAAVCTANPGVIIYNLENGPVEFTRQRSPLNFDHRSIAIFRNKHNFPHGYAVSNIEGFVAIQHVNPRKAHKDFSFQCNRHIASTMCNYFKPVHDLAFHPVHSTLATVGSDGIYNFWDTYARVGFKYSNTMNQPITKCAICDEGELFAYALGNDGFGPFEFPTKKPQIFIRPCYDDMN